MLNDYGKSLFKPWCSVQNVVLTLAFLFVAALVIRSYGLNSSEIASWVQAIGSIAAIIGAFAISSRQAKQQQINVENEDRKKKQRFRSLIIMLADQHYSCVRRLKWAVQKANYEGKDFQVYINSGDPVRWLSHQRALNSIDINQLDANHLSFLMDMQISAEYSLKLCGELEEDWDSHGDRETEIMVYLEHICKEAKDNLIYLQSEPWELG